MSGSSGNVSIIGRIISHQGKKKNGGKLILTGGYVVFYLEGLEIAKFYYLRVSHHVKERL